MSTNWPPNQNSPELPPHADLLPPEFIAILQNLAVNDFQAIEEAANSEEPNVEYGGSPRLDDKLAISAAAYSRPDATHLKRAEVGSINEDRLHVSGDGRLIVVADGMSGHAGSHIAAHLAVEIIKQCLESMPRELTNEDANNLIQLAMIAAHSGVSWYNAKRQIKGLDEVYATAAIAWMYKKIPEKDDPNQDDDWRLLSLSAGDARVLLWVPGYDELTHATLDQNGIQGWNEAKQKKFAKAQKPSDLSDGEQREFARMHAVRGLGGDSFKLGLVARDEVFPGLRILVSTDGLHDVVPDPEIVTILNKKLLPATTLVEFKKAVNTRNKRELVKVTKPDGGIAFHEAKNHFRGKSDDFSGVYGIIFEP